MRCYKRGRQRGCPHGNLSTFLRFHSLWSSDGLVIIINACCSALTASVLSYLMITAYNFCYLEIPIKNCQGQTDWGGRGRLEGGGGGFHYQLPTTNLVFTSVFVCLQPFWFMYIFYWEKWLIHQHPPTTYSSA